MVHDRDDADVLIRIAACVADGKGVDWEAEVDQSPALAPEIRALRRIDTLARMTHARHGVAGPHDVMPDPLSPGATWGPLRILERIGRGGAGDVYRAFDPSLGREVALKIWREDRVYRSTGTEARKLSKVRHARVVNVLGSERHDGLAGMWTDFLAGRSLEEVLVDRGPLPLEDACRIGIGVCEALEAVHASDMVHRDVKASNVMWLADGSVVLIDFGSAKELPGGVPAPTERIRGAPVTTAPELLLGTADVAPTADIYSLGVLLYRLVSGKYPVEAKNLRELLDGIEARRRVPLADRVPDCDPGYVRIVEQAMAWEPGDRPATPGVVRDALQRLLA